MAKARRKNRPAPSQSKDRSPKRQLFEPVVVGDPHFWEVGSRDEFWSMALCREWKERLRHLIDSHYSKTPLKQRQWDKLLDIAGECARVPGTTKIDDEKRNSMVGFLCRAIDRGELKDGKGRIQVANLHSSSLSPIRLDPKGLPFDQLVALAKQGDLFIRRKECIDCFSRHNIDFPKTWLRSELTAPDVPNTPNETPPAAPLSHQPDKQLAEECWKLPDKRPPGRESGRTWSFLKQLWPKGPPLSMSIREITEDANNKRALKYSNTIRRGFSESTVGRLLKR